MSSHPFLTDFHHVATIGATPADGVDRQAATPQDRQTREWFVGAARQRGWQVRVDPIGNLFALVDLVPGAPYVFVGSHLDSQPLGGRFDGAYGVVAAVHAADEVVRRIEEEGAPARHNIAVVDWFNEEGGRFAPSIMGSSVFAGLMDLQEMLAVTDLDGVSVRDALHGIGFLGTDEPPTPAAYAEIHIEQGRILEREGLQLGAVDSSWYTQKLDIEVLGEQSHTGATAMSDRRDALVTASRIILAVHDVCDRFEPGVLVSSVGRMTLEPNSPIVVPRRVRLLADLRADDPQIVAQARAALLERFEEIARADDVRIEAADVDIRPNRYFPQEGLELQEKVAADLGVGIRRIRTMAGHDSVPMNTLVPTVMTFIPSVDGVSHCEREFTTDADMLTGVQALAGIVWQLVHGALDGVAPAGR